MFTEIKIFDKFLKKDQFITKNKKFFFTGIDTKEECLDKNWFESYNKKIIYQINNLGFRDENVNDFENQIFVIGDSFTMGLGQPYSEIWSVKLEKLLNKRIIKISSKGASNEWIASVFNTIKN
jgi:hypothetical protein